MANRRARIKRLAFWAGLILMLAAAVGILLYSACPRWNPPSRDAYPIRGVDVSSYQGTIQWDILAKQDIAFAYIKATEGSSFTDPCFEKNWEDVWLTDLQAGAYHFFSFESSGKTQAEKYIRTVGKKEGMLPPMIDVELYGDFTRSPPKADAVVKELEEMIRVLSEYYGQAPVLYSTGKAYRLYLQGRFTSCDMWIRDVFFYPSLADGREWTFWQYTDRALLDGYEGSEKYIDMNVFFGSEKEYTAYLQKRCINTKTGGRR